MGMIFTVVGIGFLQHKLKNDSDNNQHDYNANGRHRFYELRFLDAIDVCFDLDKDRQRCLPIFLASKHSTLARRRS
jgi:hypothetical protein